MNRRPARLYSALIGLTALAVLLQGLWAGIFLEHDGGRDAAGSWVDVHARGGDLAIALAAAATVAAFLTLRARRELWAGSAVLTALLLVEAYLGGLIREQSKDTLTAVHVPLAMALMGLVVWLPVRARSVGHSASADEAVGVEEMPGVGRFSTDPARSAERQSSLSMRAGGGSSLPK